MISIFQTLPSWRTPKWACKIENISFLSRNVKVLLSVPVVWSYLYVTLGYASYVIWNAGGLMEFLETR